MVGLPVNVLALPKGPSVAELGALGVRRISTGGALGATPDGALMVGARELLDTGTSTYAGLGSARATSRPPSADHISSSVPMPLLAPGGESSVAAAASCTATPIDL